MKELGFALSAITGFGALLHCIGNWYYSRDKAVQEGECLPKNWIGWGTIRALSRNPADDFRYFYVRLPLLFWERSNEFWNDGYREGFHRPVYMRFAGRWRHWMEPLPDTTFLSAMQ